MKTTRIIGTLTLSGLIVLGMGCGKGGEQAPPTVSEPPKPAPETTATAPTPASPTAATANTEAQSLIEKAKTLIAEKKYAEALDLLKQLGNMQLTAEQQKIVDDLKAMVQKNMTEQGASEAGKAAGNLLGGQK